MSRLLLEIGSRHGGFMETLARRNPDDECLGLEYRYVWARDAREKARRRELGNIRYLCGDARIVVQRLLEPASVAEVYVLFPDPWPKKRHRKRRLLQAPFLADLARVMLPGAPLFVLTDVEDYAVFIAQEVSLVPQLEPLPAEDMPDEATTWGPTRRERVPHLLEDSVQRIFARRRLEPASP